MNNKKDTALMLSMVCIFGACTKGKHNYSTEWSYNESVHWHSCTDKDCEEKMDEIAHTFDDGVITTEPTAEANGTKTFTCTVCSWLVWDS